jgi:peptidoglycan/LPS O-acetylase OafA/YrhL
MRRQVPLIITFFIGALLVISVFIPPMVSLKETFTLYFDIIAVFAFFLGGGNLLRVHLGKLYGKKQDWGFSLVTVAGFTMMLIVGLFKIGNPGGIAASITAEGSCFQKLFEYIMVPLGSTMYALLAFFVASASYRAFRAKNREATILLIGAFIILLGRTPFGMMLTSWIPEQLSILQIPNLAIWIMNGPNLAGQRAIMIGIGLGVVSMSIRILLGIERSYLGEDK